MPTAPVLDVNEVNLFGVSFPIVRGVRPFLVNQLVPQIRTGEGDPTREEKASKWHLHNTAGGFGRYRLELAGSDTTDKFWDSSVRTDQGEITLLPLATEALAMGAQPAAILEWGSAVYVFAGTVIRRFNNGTTAQFYCTTHSTWEDGDPTGGHSARALSANAVSASVYSGVLLIWCGTDYTSYDGSTTWRDQTEDASYAVTYDEKCVKVDSSGQLKWSTDPGVAVPAWTNIGKIHDAAPTGMTIYEDANGDPAVYVGTVRGPWVLDFVAGKAYPTKARFSDANSDNCRGIAAWNGDLFFPKGGNVRRYIVGGQAQMVDIGPNRDDGLPSTKVGRVVALETTLEHFLIAAIDADSRTSSVMKWSGSAWHTLVEADAANEPIRALCFSSLTSTPRLWFGQGNSVWWIPLWDIADNPVQAPSSTYRASGDLITPWFGIPSMRSIGIDLRFRCKGISSTETVTVYYATNDEDTTWNTLGSVPKNGTTTLKFSTLGKEFYSIRFKISLARGATTTNTPRILAATFRWTPAPRALWGYSFEVNTSSPHKGREPSELVAALQEAGGGEVGMFSYRPDDDRYVRVEQLQALEQTGHDHRGRWSVTVSEVVAMYTEATTYFKWDGQSKWDGTKAWK